MNCTNIILGFRETSSGGEHPARVDVRLTLALVAFALASILWPVGGELGAADTLLADAIENSSAINLNAEIEKGADVNAPQADGMTALHWAVFYDDTELSMQLIALGADASAENRYSVTPMSIACLNGNSKIVEALLKAGADPNGELSGGESALMTASRTGCPRCVAALLEAGAEVDHVDRKKQTAVMWAAAEGNTAVVEALIAGGADLHATLDSGFSPLLFAVREGRAEVVRLLLEHGANVNEHMNPEKTGGRNPRRGMSPLHLAIENGHFELAVFLLEQGADPNDQRCGYSPLHTVAWVRKPPRGDNVDGAPPPIGSGNMTSLQFVRILIAMGADVNLRLKKGSGGRGKMHEKAATPFLFAARRDDVPYMELLLELGADPTIPNADNCTPLLVAAGIGTQAPGEEAGTEEEALEAVELLLKLGADINHVDANGETAMHGAAYKNLPLIVTYLGEHGAEIAVWNQKNKYGWTPTLIAEGHRPGNFRPAAATLAAVYTQLRAAGVEPPPLTPRERRLGYDQ